MHAEIAAAPEAAPPRRLDAALVRLSLPAAVFLTLALELLLAERKFAVFAGGFGQSRAIDTPGEVAAFLPALLAAHAFLFYLFYRLVRRLHGRRADTPLFHFNFFYLSTFLGSAVLVAKYQALSYFSDAMSFQVVRNMGGGSIIQALLYTLDEGALMLFVAAGAFGVYAAIRFVLRRRLRGAAPLPDRTVLRGRSFAALLAAVPLLLLAASQVGDVRSGLGRFNAPYLFTALFDQLSDFDRDGFGFFSAPADTHPFDGSRHPFALDVPNNGVDEDGFAGDLVLADPAPAPAPPVRIAGERPHVVLIVLESTRGDIIGRRFRGRPVAPNLEALAAGGTSAPAAFSHAGFTSFSLKTLFTGRLVPEGPETSLFEAFRANGYRTGALSAQAEDFGSIAQTVGMRRANVFVDAETLKSERVYGLGSESSLRIDDGVVLREFDRHFGRAEAWTRPNFVYLNLQSAHFPYDHPGMGRPLGIEPLPRGDISAANRERLEETYWNAAAYADRMVGEVVARLRRLGVWDRTLLVVTADHGESLFEDGFLGHGHMINRRQNHIPFVMNRRVAVPSPVGLADVRGIVLRAAGADVPPEPGATPGRVFQYIGSLDRPSSIGVADAGGRFTVFSFDRAALWTSGTERWKPYEALAPGSAARGEADALIREWGRQRWLNRAGG
ncbi:MAG TPA: sulfatase-like hydrolase/transferase [Allosphingosinicella sp.]